MSEPRPLPAAAPESGDAPPEPDQTLDARDLRCPLPVLRAQKTLRGMAPGQVLEVVASDPASVEDMRRFSAQGAAELVAQRTEGESLFRHWLRRRPG
ncbi:sulfurtransferase TusA family protein [uncultured Rhodospira sp.]|uniref:sulfurtransferase TusA family protein n=1 Tax=uncultured Rhodospira sp. TaxID=1936189 RepID=UPI00260A9FBF|nr:sulfurtransferase TusA family protein [uncultured Rhodospira sp.]